MTDETQHQKLDDIRDKVTDISKNVAVINQHLDQLNSKVESACEERDKMKEKINWNENKIYMGIAIAVFITGVIPVLIEAGLL